MIMITFLVIMVSISFVRYLSMAADGEIPLKNAIAILGVILPNFINLLMPITLFLAIVVGVNRLLHDNELLIGFACGMSFTKLIRKIFRFALPLFILSLLLNFLIVPKMNQYQDELSEISSQNASMLSFIQSGRFFPLGSNQIVYVSNIDFKSRQSQGIFLYQNMGETTRIVLAPVGEVESQGNTLAKVNLKQGQEYEFSNDPNSLALRTLTFDSLVMALIPNYDFTNDDLSAISTKALIQKHDRPSLVELEWRAALPFAILVLTILGTVLSNLRPRTSRLIKIFYAVAIFIIYFNLMSVVKSLVLNNRMPIFPGLFLVHAAFLLMGIILLGIREGWFNFFHRVQKS